MSAEHEPSPPGPPPPGDRPQPHAARPPGDRPQPHAAPSMRWIDAEPRDGWRSFEFTSRGDRVVARLHVPAGPGPHALAVVAGAAAPAADNLAVATLDLPLLGARRSPKWTERLERCLADGPRGAADAVLLQEFRAQAASDVATLLAVSAEVPGLDPVRAGLLGRGAAALVAADLARSEPRLKAVVLCAEGVAPGLVLDAEGAGVLRAANAAEGIEKLRAALGEAAD